MQAIRTCPKCGSPRIRTKHVPKYQYRESGLDDIWLEGKGVLEARCASCGARFVRVLKERQLLQVIAVGLLMRPGFLVGKEIRYLRETCGLTQTDLANILGKDRRASITEWETQAEPSRDQAWEYFLRTALLRQFVRMLRDGSKRHLSQHHIDALEKWCGQFYDEVVRFVSASDSKPRLSLVKRTERTDWQPTAKAA